MNNAAFGKAIENERKHGHVNLATAKAEKEKTFSEVITNSGEKNKDNHD